MPKRTCSVDGCEKPHCARDLCPMHYMRWRRNGNPVGLTEPLPATCPECLSPVNRQERPRAKYCSNRCRDARWNRLRFTPSGSAVTTTCARCSQSFEFVQVTGRFKYCPECRPNRRPSLTVCKKCGAPKPSRNRFYCETCSAERQAHYYGRLSPEAIRKKKSRDRFRGSTSGRGYGSAHQKLKNRLRPLVARGDVQCVRCGLLIPPAGEGICPAILNGRRCGKNHHGWDLGHNDHDRTQWTGPEHVCCNRRTATRKAAERRSAVEAPQVRQASRVW